MILVYTLTIAFFVIPEIVDHSRRLEEHNAKEVLSKVVMMVNNVHKDLKQHRDVSLSKHKEELKKLTDIIWGVIQARYTQSLTENIGSTLKERAQEFSISLMNFYNENKHILSEDELKSAVINHIQMHRYHNGAGYFWANTLSSTMVVHPINPELNNTDIGDYQDPDGVYVFREMQSVIVNRGAGLTHYRWLNPLSQQIEKKVSYVFHFAPFNWMIGTGEYHSVLKKRLQDEVFELISRIRYGENGYFYITDYDNIMLVHPYLKGQDFSEVKDIKGKLIIPPMVKIAIEQGEGFSSYWWKKNAYDKTPYEKLTYLKDFPAWQVIIYTGLYVETLEREINKRKKVLTAQLREVIQTTQLGETGYLYVFNSDGIMLIHPNENIDSTNFKSLPNPTKGSYLFDDLIKASRRDDHALYYQWDKPLDKGNYIYDKISWVKYIPELDWYIASSVYVEEFRNSADRILNLITKLALGLLFFSLLYGVIFFKQLLNPIAILSQLSLRISSGDYQARYRHTLSNDEIGILAEEFNNMIDTIESNMQSLDEQSTQLKQLNLTLVDSMEYAALIQTALIPTEEKLSHYFADTFVIWQPRDIVGGDIYLFEDLRNIDEALFMVIDCTGHGVAGAFVTMLVKAVEREIIANINKNDYDISPAIILQHFNKRIKELLRQDGNTSTSNSGFDGAIVYMNKRTQQLKFAGANLPLYYLDGNELTILPGDRHSIGYKSSDINYQFNEHNINIKDDRQFYLSTDGYIDQKGGNKGFSFGHSRFENILQENYDKSMQQQKVALLNALNAYQGDQFNVDDITVIGWRLKT